MLLLAKASLLAAALAINTAKVKVGGCVVAFACHRQLKPTSDLTPRGNEN
jgi:hypothetical protein